MQSSFFGESLDLTNTAPATEFKPLDAGTYTAVCIEAVTESKDWGVNAKVKFKITEGANTNRIISDGGFGIIHRKSEKANDINQRRLRSWCDAIGIPPNINSLDQFIGKTVNVKVRVEQSNGINPKTGNAYGPSNRIDSFSAASATALAPSPIQRTASPAATAAVAPSQTAALAETTAAQAPVKKMPWQQKATA